MQVFLKVNDQQAQDAIRQAIEKTNDPARKRALQEELDKRIGNTGVLSETDRLQKEIERQREALRFSSLTKDQQLLELTQKRAQLEKEIAESRDKLTQAQSDVTNWQAEGNRLQALMNDNTVPMYGPGRAGRADLLEQAKRNLATAQQQVTDLKEEGRRKSYR